METLVNFRELGGIKTKDNASIKQKKILRSGEVYKISEKDKTILLQEYNLKRIYDFRDVKEVAEKPDDTLEGVGYYNIDIMKDFTDNNSSRESFLKNIDLDGAVHQMKELYRKIVISEAAKQGYHDFIESMTTLEEGSLLFHCFAGKDRTGIGAAIILELLGVHRDDIFEDYLKTNELRRVANEIIIKEARENGITETQATALAALVSVKETYLQEAYKTIEEHYKTFDQYVEMGLKLTADTVEKLRMIYLD